MYKRRLVDCTVGVQGVDLVRDLLVDAFEHACTAGPLAGQRLRGVRLDLVDALVHPVGSSRRAAQVVPAACRAIAAAVLCAAPVLIEPVSAVTLHAPLRFVGDVHDELGARRRALHIEHAPRGGAGLLAGEAADAQCDVRADVPTAELGGLGDALRGKLHGAARGLRIAFGSWAPVPDANAEMAVRTQRTLKGLPAAVPLADAVADKL